MATALVNHSLAASAGWTDIAGAAASVAGVTWQNVGRDPVVMSFTAIAPTSTDAYIVLPPMGAFYDANGSANVWAKAAGLTGALLTAIGD